MAKRYVTPPEYPRLARSNWEFVGLKYYFTLPNGHKARQGARVELHYHVPPRAIKAKRVVKRKYAGEIPKAERMRMLRAEQKDLLAGLQAQSDATEGSLTPVRQRELQRGFAAAGMAHLIG